MDCPKCGSDKVSGLMSAFRVELDDDGSPVGDWNDWSSDTQLGERRMCRACQHEWE